MPTIALPSHVYLHKRKYFHGEYFFISKAGRNFNGIYYLVLQLVSEVNLSWLVSFSPIAHICFSSQNGV